MGCSTILFGLVIPRDDLKTIRRSAFPLDLQAGHLDGRFVGGIDAVAEIGRRSVCCPSRCPAGIRILSALWIVACFFGSTPCFALSVMFPGEGIKVVTARAGKEIQKVREMDNDVGRAVDGGLRLIDPNTWGVNFDQFNFAMTAAGYKKSVDGNKSRSFFDRGTHEEASFKLDGKKRYLQLGGGEFSTNASVRFTDDRQVQPKKRWLMQGVYGTFERADRYSLRLGNVSGSFSSYSLSASSNVGIHYTNKFLGDQSPAQEFQMYLARPTRALAATSFDRFVYGFRLGGIGKSRWKSIQQLGLSYAKTKDQVDSIEDTNARPANAVENDVYAVDADLNVTPKLNVKAEAAYSRFDPNTQSDPTDRIFGYAYKFNTSYQSPARWMFDPARWSLGFEHVDPTYRATSGGGSADAQRFNGGVSTALKSALDLPDAQIGYTFSGNKNNLDGQLARRTTTEIHSANASFKPFQKYALEKSGARIKEIAKNMSASAAVQQNKNWTSDNTTHTTTNNQNYQLNTSTGSHTLSTFFRYQITTEKTAATGNRRNESKGLTYGYRDFAWRFFPAARLLPEHEFKTDLSLNATQTLDKTMDAAGRSHNRQYGVTAQTDVRDDERLDVNYSLGLTDNLNENSDIRTTNWKFAYVIEKFIHADGELGLSYTQNRTREEIKTQDYREELWRVDANLKWGGPPAEVAELRQQVEFAVQEILKTFASEDYLGFVKLVSDNFKANREELLINIQNQLNMVDTIKYDGVWISRTVPVEGGAEVTFLWQRRLRVTATGAEERQTGTALFRLEKSGDLFLLQEIREANPFF